MIKTIQLFKPFYRTEEILERIRGCCEKGWTGMGDLTNKFEEEFKKYCHASKVHLLSSATAGLQLAVLQLKEKYNWKDGDEIITTSVTFVSSNHAILYNNLKPVFADIDEHGTLCPESVQKRITNKTRAILFVGLGGQIGRFNDIVQIAQINKLKLILDAAHMGGTKDYNHVPICSQNGIDVCVHSFQSVKNLPSSDAGTICWNGEYAEELDAQSRRLSWLGINKTTFDRTSSEKGSYKWHYDVPELGFKMHSNSIMAAFTLVGLKYLDQDNAYRRYLSDLYTAELRDYVEIVPSSIECISSRHLFQILVEDRDKIMLALNGQGVFPGVHYRSNLNYPMYSYAMGNCPKAENFSNKTISLPLHMYLTVEDVFYICDALKESLKRSK